ncbi:MAG: tetratricopeptide repeat protein [Nonlabens sp.]
MKRLITCFFLAASLLTFAQKKEIKNIKKALKTQDIQKAYDAFESIDESAVEAKYAADYNLYKAAYKIDVSGQRSASFEDLRIAETSLEKAISLGLKDKTSEMYVNIVENAIRTRKLALANEMMATDTATAISLVDELYALDETNYDMLYNSANMSYSIEDFETAMLQYEKLVATNYDGVRKSLYAVNKQNGTRELFPNTTTREIAIKSGSHMTPTEEQSPSNVGDVATKLVWLKKSQKDLNAAKAMYEKIKRQYPSDDSLTAAEVGIFQILEMDEEYAAAVKKMNDINDPQIFMNLAESAATKKNYDSAIEYYNKALQLDSSSYFSSVNIANAYLEKGNLETTTAVEQMELYKSAVKNLENAHKIKPDEKGIMSTLISLYDFLEMTDKSAAMKAKM